MITYITGLVIFSFIFMVLHKTGILPLKSDDDIGFVFVMCLMWPLTLALLMISLLFLVAFIVLDITSDLLIKLLINMNITFDKSNNKKDKE